MFTKLEEIHFKNPSFELMVLYHILALGYQVDQGSFSLLVASNIALT
jgi:hypothetical protein